MKRRVLIAGGILALAAVAVLAAAARGYVGLPDDSGDDLEPRGYAWASGYWIPAP